MNVLMVTNTYKPHVGGVAKSVAQVSEGLRSRGLDVHVIAPEFEEPASDEHWEHRAPTLSSFNGTDFALPAPMTPLDSLLPVGFRPDIVHAHHPYLLGDQALRLAARLGVPLVFTHHTMYEHYVHYASMEADAARTFIVELGTGFANLASRVVAPSESVRDILRERGVESPIDVIPTGISLEEFRRGGRQRLRKEHGIPRDAFVVGHIGRLAPEKNLGFLAAAVARFLDEEPDARFLVTGDGESLEEMRDVMRARGVAGRFHATGKLTGPALVDAYHAMDVFAFASKSETQGMVLAEALAAGCPVVALDAPGARETTPATPAGELVAEEDEEAFAAALSRMRQGFAQDPEGLRRAARQAARPFSRQRCLARMLDCYNDALQSAPACHDLGGFDRLTARLRCEGELWSNRATAAMEALRRDPAAT